MKYVELSRIASSQQGLITLEQLRDHYSEGQITRLKESGLLVRVGARVLAVAAAPPSYERDVLAVLLSNPHAVASHRTAAYLWRLIEFDELDTHIDITMAAPHFRRVRRVHVHQSDAVDRTRTKNGVRLTNPARTLIDISCTTPLAYLKELIEKAIQMRLITLASLRAENERIAERGRNGVGVIREILDEYDPVELNIRSPFERRTRRALIAIGLPEPKREWRVMTKASTRFIDFAYPDIGLGIEVDSRTWHTRLRDFDKDRQRHGELVEAGFLIVSITSADFDEGIERVARIYWSKRKAA